MCSYMCQGNTGERQEDWGAERSIVTYYPSENIQTPLYHHNYVSFSTKIIPERTGCRLQPLEMVRGVTRLCSGRKEASVFYTAQFIS